MHQQARRRLADLLAAGRTDDELARAEELYISLVATDALDHRLWEALARLHGARNDLLGLEATFRRLRSATGGIRRRRRSRPGTDSANAEAGFRRSACLTHGRSGLTDRMIAPGLTAAPAFMALWFEFDIARSDSLP
jgi:hypothetical protein